MRLMEHLPLQVYNGEEHVVDLQDAIEVRVAELRAARDDLFLQLRPATATWGLERFEREYGISTDISKPLEQRREFLRAKKRGLGTTTNEMLRNMAASFTGGKVEVIDRAAEDIVEIYFVGTWGVPEHVEDLVASIYEILPAHLELVLAYKYLTFGRLTAQNITFGELSARGLTFAEFAEGKWTDGR